MEGYTKVKQIGKGNMGVCSLAKTDEGKLAVLKDIDLTKLNRKDREQSLGEARLLQAMSHPNVVRYMNSWLTRDEHLVIAMEYMHNGDLCTKVEKSRGVPFKEDTILDWFIEIALALKYLARKHVLHRDLKTQNILITSDNVLKLADFGISRVLKNAWDHAHTFVGTPYYLSPELLQSRPYNYQSDMWALGVVLCEMMTQTHPFQGHDMKSLSENILSGRYVKPPAIYSSELRELVTLLLQKDPKKRITIGELLQKPIIQKRIHRWLTESILPGWYIHKLLKHNVLDGVVPAEWIQARGEEPILHPHPPQPKEQEVIRKFERIHHEERKKILQEFASIDAGQLRMHAPRPPKKPAPPPPSRNHDVNSFHLPPLPLKQSPAGPVKASLDGFSGPPPHRRALRHVDENRMKRRPHIGRVQ